MSELYDWFIEESGVSLTFFQIHYFATYISIILGCNWGYLHFRHHVTQIPVKCLALESFVQLQTVSNGRRYRRITWVLLQGIPVGSSDQPTWYI